MNSHNFKIQIEENFDDLALLQLDAYWVDCESKANFLARKFASSRTETDLRDVGELYAPVISAFPLLMIYHLRGIFIARRAQLRSANGGRALAAAA